MNPFKRSGFDSIIALGTFIGHDIKIGPGQTFAIDGRFDGDSIRAEVDEADCTLIVGGVVQANIVNVKNVTITGTLACKTLIVQGQLAVKNGAHVKAEEIQYRSLVVEPKAILSGSMKHLDIDEVVGDSNV